MDIVYYAIFGFVEDSLAFSPRNAIRSADYVVARRLSVCPSVCLSHAGVIWKRLNISSIFFTVGSTHHSSFSMPIIMPISRPGPPNGGVECRV